MFSKLSKGLSAPPESVSTSMVSARGDAPRARPDSRFHSPFHMVFQTEDEPMFDPYKIPGSRSLHERKMATWALLIGETYSSAVHAEMRRRPHRGMLPDVDFSRAVPDRGRPSLVRRIVGLIRGGGAKDRASGTAPTGSLDDPVGESHPVAYIAREKTGDTGDSVALDTEVARRAA